jgi:mannitol-1-phosphate 5-dehydrogenase
MKLLQFGAGNIGRSFIGKIFSDAGWDVVFIDVNEKLVQLLSERKYYNVIIKQEGKSDEVFRIGPVRAIHSSNETVIAEELATADLVSTSVGKAALHAIIPLLAQGLKKRYHYYLDRPLDIIIAENAPGAKNLFLEIFSQTLGSEYPLTELVGLVESSIGKMVPLMKKEDLEVDQLQIFAESYETLILDRLGFCGPLPGTIGKWPESIQLVDDINAFVARKLYIHNLGHVAVAYLGFITDPSLIYIADAVRLPEVRKLAFSCMKESATALVAHYPQAYNNKQLNDHIEDLLERFANRALKDTIYRVGRDLYRKLDRDDRLVGAMRLCATHRLPFSNIIKVYHAALRFEAKDEAGCYYPSDSEFRPKILSKGLDAVLQEVSHLNPEDPIDQIVMKNIRLNS